MQLDMQYAELGVWYVIRCIRYTARYVPGGV